jgi:hypothetical protein
MSAILAKPKVNSRWRSKNGAHKGMEVIVSKLGDTTVVVSPVTGNKKTKLKGKALTWRLPIDAFYRRYEQC